MSFITSGSGAITDPANAPIDVTRNSAGPYLPGVAYTWNITNLDDYTTYTLTTTNGTITRTSATLTYTPSTSGAGGWTMNGRQINLTIASISAFVSSTNASAASYTGANSANSNYSIGAWTANIALGVSQSPLFSQYSSTGALQWHRYFYDPAAVLIYQAWGAKLASDNTTFALVNDGGNTRAYIIKLSVSGTVVWSKYLSNFVPQYGAIAVDSSDNVIFGGYSGGLTAIAKYNTSGTQQWQFVSGANSDFIYGITTDASNNIFFVTGNSTRCFVVKLNSAGTVQWSTRLDNTQIYGNGIALDSAGNVYVCGQYFLGGTTDYGFICKLNSSGVVQWQFQDINVRYFGIAVDSSDNVYTSGPVYSGGSPGGSYNIVKRDSLGTVQWARNFSASSGAQATQAYISIAGSSYYLTCSGFVTNFLLNQGRFPIDGSIPTFSIGSGPGSYISTSVTTTAGTMTNPAGSLTLAVSALAETTSTLTNGSTGLTVQLKQGV